MRSSHKDANFGRLSRHDQKMTVMRRELTKNKSKSRLIYQYTCIPAILFAKQIQVLLKRTNLVVTFSKQEFTFFTQQLVYLKCLEENLGQEYVKNFSRVSKAPTFSQPSFLEF